MHVPRIGRPLGRYAPLLITTTLAASLAVPALAATLTTSSPPVARNPAPELPLSLTTTHNAAPGAVTLVTGERVRLLPGPDGRASVSVQPAASGTPTLLDSFDINGDVYAVPGYALPYLGSRLDPRLFDVSYLRRAGFAGRKSLPLTVTWKTSQHTAVPGLTAGRGTSATSTADFGQMLRTSPAAFSQVQRISLGAAPAAAAPAVPLTASHPAPGTGLYTLTINALDREGKPGAALIMVQNLSDLREYYSVSAFAGSQLALSVPAGKYAIEAGISDFGFNGPVPLGNTAFVPLPTVTVSHDTIVTADARQAQPITVKVPAKVAPEVAGMSFTRTSAAGGGLSAMMFGFGPGVDPSVPALNMYAKPAAAPATGSLGFSDSWELQTEGTGLGGTNVPFTYNLDFASADGVPSRLSHTLTAADLAAQQDSFASSVAGAGMYSSAAPFHSWSPTTFALMPTVVAPFPVPAVRTDYFGGSTSTVWDEGVEPVVPTEPPYPPYTTGAYRTYHPGQSLKVTWGAGPSLPVPEWQDMGLAPGSQSEDGTPRGTWAYICPVCQQGQVMAFNLAMSGDNDPTHSEGEYGIGSGSFAAAAGSAADQIRFYRNGVLTQVADSSGQVFPLLPGKASYRIDWAATIPDNWTQLSTTTDSSWTFTANGNPAASQLPSYEVCSPDLTQRCSFLPLVFASYDFGSNLQGQVTAPGTETFTITSYHEAGDSGPAINHATVRVSFDDGKTWSPVSGVTSLGAGKFKVTLTQPVPSATSGYASFKVTLTDAAGDSLQQTIHRAYALTGR